MTDQWQKLRKSHVPEKRTEIEIQFWATYSCLFALASLGVNLLASLFMFRHWSPVPSRSNCQIVNATRISTKTQLINNPNMVPRASPSLPLPTPPSDLPSYSDKKEIFSLIALCLWKDPAMEAKFAWSCFVILTIILDTKAILFLNKTFFR